MTRKKVMKKVLTLNVIYLSLLGIVYGQYIEDPRKNEPYPSNPVGMQIYINKTKPNVAIAMDNSITMDIKMKRRTLGNKKPLSERPRRIDVVKDAMLRVVNQYGDHLNFTYANITDYARDLHWRIDPTAPRGYVYAPDHGRERSKNMEKYSKDTYNELPFYKKGDKKEILQRTPGTAIELKSAFANNKGRTYVGDVRMFEEALPETAESLTKSQRKKVGNSLLVPYQDIYSHLYDKTNHKKSLELAIKTTGLRVSFLQYIYPNYVDYMADKIKYRCQDTFMLVVTDGNTITNSKNRKAAQKYFSVNKTPDLKKNIGLRPKSSKEKDGDGYYYNGPDFSEQNIRSYAIGIGTNARKFKRFENYGGGKAATAIYVEDVEEILEEFMKDMQPSNIFSMTSPAGSFLYTSDAQTILMANINTETKGWVGELRFTKNFAQENPDDDGASESAKYIPNYAVYLASTNKGLINLGNKNASTTLTHQDLNLASTIPVDAYLKWLTAYTEVTEEIDEETKEPYEVIQGDTLPIFKDLRRRSADALSENRYLGDVLSSSLEMIGNINNIIKAPEYLTVGSNDGMLKLYKANPDYTKSLGITKVPIYEEDDDKNDNDDTPPKIIGYEDIETFDTAPYTFSFAYIPGTVQKNNGLNVLQSLTLRAAPSYSFAPRPVHQYNVNGEIAFRTTSNGHTFLVGTLGQGGKGAFALNVAGTDEITKDPVGLDASKAEWEKTVPLWDTSSPSFGNAAAGSESLGYIMGKPVIGRVALNRQNKLPNLDNNVKYVAVIGSGAFGDQTIEKGPTLYIYDALGVDSGLQASNVGNASRKTGELLKKVTYEFSDSEKLSFKYQNSLSEPTLIDLDRDGVVDIGYVGDLNGNLYRLDLRSNEMKDWKLDLIFIGDVSRPILYAPSISRFFQRSFVIFGTGSLARKEMSEVRHQQILYGIMENKNFTAHIGTPVTSTDARLIDQKITKNGNTATVTDARVPLKGYVGWRLPLGYGKDIGEALAQKPIIYNGTIFFQTYVYRDNQKLPDEGLMCYRSLDTSDTWLYQINALTGGALDENSTYLKRLTRGTAGKKTTGIIDQPVKLIEANKSPSVSKDGEMLSGNDIDIVLNPKVSSKDEFDLDDKNYITEDPCKAMLSNGMELVCPTEVKHPKEKLPPKRISIMQMYCN